MGEPGRRRGGRARAQGARAGIALRLAAVALSTFAVRAAAFVDPLDAPARPSALASRGLLVGVAAAGGRLVAVGERGHALWSDDGGARWTQASVPVSADLTAVHLVSARRGWAVGHGGVVLATQDGGASWTRQLDGRDLVPLLRAGEATAAGAGGALLEQVRFLAAQGPATPFLDVWFDDERTGFAVGAFNLVVRTGDGGRSWTPWIDRTDNPRGLHLYAIRRVAGDLWIAGEQGLLLKLDTAGERFRAVRTPYEGSFFGVTGDDAGVLVHGLRGHAFRSADGGETWRAVETGVEAALTGGTATGDGRIVLVSLAGEVLVSADAGVTFRPAGRGRPAAGVAAAGADGVVLVGRAGVEVRRLE